MIFIFVLIDRPQASKVRAEVRPAHKAYLGQKAEQIAFAGPLTADDGIEMIGSILAIDFPDRMSASTWMEQEPFNRAGLYASIQIYPFSNLWPQKAGFPNQ